MISALSLPKKLLRLTWHRSHWFPDPEAESSLDLLMRAARWLLVLVSMGPGPSELRVARGLATGALDFPLVSPVHRRMNCNVGPWENVSNGGSLCGRIKPDRGQRLRLDLGHGTDWTTHKPATFPSRMVSHVARFLLMGLSSIPCIDTSYSPSSSCSLLRIKSHSEFKTADYTKGKRSRPYNKNTPVLIKDCHLRHISLCSLPLLSVGWTSLLSSVSIWYIFAQKQRNY